MSNTVTIGVESSTGAANTLNHEAGFMKNSISAVREKSGRISTRQKMSSVEKFISLVDANESEKRLMLLSAALWYELRCQIDVADGMKAIQYAERVNQSLTHMNIQGWMARQTDKLANAKQYRKRTAPGARARLDRLIVIGLNIEECASEEFGNAHQTAVKSLRKMIVENLKAFAALTMLPGAN
jgi:hypothetical protein